MYMQRLPMMHAKSFLFALDTVANCIRVLAEKSDATHKVQAVMQDWVATFPTVKGLRDTAHHMEDRARGLGRKDPLVLQPVNSQGINAPGGALILDHLNGNTYGGTVFDGSYAEVEVSRTSLAMLGGLVQQAIDAFEWEGWPQSVPT
ncbi:hypothetical protein COUCH_34225 [Couchioplanes caeruleus]|uniref:hypothetical protein n=1 Tax=Couchioplanes caeruleus TaxID=56438 RepID=UPI0020C0379C|nr:hypothetical protein [Couchioplanes caeruleus]UQU63981.1 hypothetical protein COUCH_34225 [Couchioplanes caeruleus]